MKEVWYNMAVFRIARTHDYTVMSNYHLRDKSLSLKAKGLLSQMLSLPESWDYTLSGLVSINKEKKDAIRTALVELEEAGYLIRHRLKDEMGQFTSNEYIIFERPQSPSSDFPTLDYPTLENPPQLNTELIKDRNNKLPTFLPKKERLEGTYEQYKALVKKNIEYDALAMQYGEEDVNEVVEIILEVIMTKDDPIMIGKKAYPREMARSRFLKLNMSHIVYLFDYMSRVNTQIWNMKTYIMTILFNAPVTMKKYYENKVKCDMKGVG